MKQKVLRGLYDNALQGKAVGGLVPWGLKLNEEKRYVIDQDKSPVVREIFNRYILGESVTSICNNLTARGIRGLRGNPFDKSSIIRLLKNQKYAGIYCYSSRDENNKNIYSEDAIPAIITREIFEKAQERLKSNKRKKAKDIMNNVIFYLSGKAYDGNCHGALIGDSGTSKTGKKYYYYSCTNKKQKRTCKTPSVPKDWLEDIVLYATKEFVLKDDLIDYIANSIELLQRDNTDNSVSKLIEKELKITQNSIKNILDAIEKGIYTDTTKDRLLELEVRKAALETELKIENLKTKAPKITKEHIIYMLQQLREGDTTKEAYKKQVIDSFVDTVILYDDTVTIAYKFTGENDLIEIPYQDYSDAATSVRMYCENWRWRELNSRPK